MECNSNVHLKIEVLRNQEGSIVYYKTGPVKNYRKIASI
jgi:hypothetical protein